MSDTVFQINLEPNPRQVEVINEFYYNQDCQDLLMVGGVRGGKTSIGLYLTAAESLRFSGVDCLIVRETHDTAVTVEAEEFFKLFPPEAIRTVRDLFNKKEGILTWPNGSRIFFWGLGKEGEETGVFDKIESAGFSFVFIDNARKIPRKVYRYAQTRMSGKGSRKILLSTNPPPNKHWLNEEFPEKGNAYPNRKKIMFSTRDNEKNLPEDYFIRLSYLPKSWKKVYVDGETGEAYDEPGVFEHDFNFEVHVDPKFDLTPMEVPKRLVGALDFGFNSPAAVLFKENRNRTVDIFYEKMGDRETIIDFLDDLAYSINLEYNGLTLHDFFWVGDIAGSYVGNTGQQDWNLIRRNHGITVHGQKLGKVSSIYPLQIALTTFIANDPAFPRGRPALGINPKCEYVIGGFLGGYRIDSRGHVVKDPIYEHIMDTVRYGFNQFSYSSILMRDRRTRIKENPYIEPEEYIRKMTPTYR